jgi:hypothetical protein
MCPLSRGRYDAPSRALDHTAIPRHCSEIEARPGDRPNECLRGWSGAWALARRAAGPLQSDSGLGGEYDSPAGKLNFKAEWKRWRTAKLASAITSPTGLVTSLASMRLNDSFSASWRGSLAFDKCTNLVNAINSDRFDYSELRAILDKQVNRRELSESGLLMQLGLIEKDDSANFQAPELVTTMLSTKRLATPQFRALLLGKPAAASLGCEEFAHLGELRDLAARIV